MCCHFFPLQTAAIGNSSSTVQEKPKGVNIGMLMWIHATSQSHNHTLLSGTLKSLNCERSPAPARGRLMRDGTQGNNRIHCGRFKTLRSATFLLSAARKVWKEKISGADCCRSSPPTCTLSVLARHPRSVMWSPSGGKEEKCEFVSLPFELRWPFASFCFFSFYSHRSGWRGIREADCRKSLRAVSVTPTQESGGRSFSLVPRAARRQKERE